MSDELSENEQRVDDDDLVIRASTDCTAFTVLYDRYYPRVARYCLRRLFDRTVAEDVTSEVFLHVVSHLPQFPGRTETDFRRWLFRIATNAINGHLRQSRRRQVLREAAARSRRLNCTDSFHTSHTEPEALDWLTLYQALLELDERDQSIITLRFFAGCSHEEIADVLGSTPGAVRTALSRTLSRLRERFDSSVPPSPTVGQLPRN